MKRVMITTLELITVMIVLPIIVPTAVMFLVTYMGWDQ